MEYQRFDSKIIVRLDRGDYVMDSLKEVAKKESIQTGFISAIGAVDLAQLNYFFLNLQNYKTVDFEEAFEVLSMNGNITQNNGEPHLHLHTVLSRSDYSTIGGHLLDARVSITLEVIIDIIDTTITREDDEEINNFKYMKFDA